MKTAGMRYYFIISVSLLILVVLGVTGALNIASFKQTYTQSLISGYGVLGGETVKKIEYAIKYGKPLENFYGMEELLGSLQKDSPSIRETYIVLPAGQRIYAASGQIDVMTIPQEMQKELSFAVKAAPLYESHIYKSDYHVFIPIHNASGEWIGSLELVFGKNTIESNTGAYIRDQLVMLGLFAIVSILLLLLVIFKVSLTSDNGEIRKKRLLIFIFTLLGCLQIILGIVNYNMLKNGYLDTLKTNTDVILTIVERDIESVIDKGVPYAKLHGVGDYLLRLIESVPEIDRVSVIDTGFTAEREQEAAENERYSISAELKEDVDGRNNYRAVIDLSRSYVNGKMREMLLDMLTMLVVSFLLMVEITLFVVILLNKRAMQTAEGDEEKKLASLRGDRTIIRPLAFIMFMAMYMSTAFIPVLMKSLYKPIFGLKESVVVGLPISAELLSMAAASMIAGYLVDRKGWKPVFTFGCAIVAIGTIASGLAFEPVGFIASRALAGFGFGFALMSMQAFVVTAPTESAKNDALSSLNSGAYAGINTGVVVGAMMADRIGFSQVFFVAFALIGIGAMFALKWMINVKQEDERTTPESGQSDKSEASLDALALPSRKQRMELLRLEQLKEKRPVKGFISDWNVIVYFMFLLIPVAVGGMFLSYFFPLFAEEEGLSPSNIGRAFLLNGLCIVYLGPLLTKLAERFVSNKVAAVAAAIVMIGALALFSGMPSMKTAIATVVVLGIAEGFGLTASINYYIGLKSAQWFGEGKAMGYYSLVENFGQMLGPMLFGSLIVFFSAASGAEAKATGVIALIVAISLVLFIALSRREKPLSVSTGTASGIGGDI